MHQWRREAIQSWANKADFNATGYAKRNEMFEFNTFEDTTRTKRQRNWNNSESVSKLQEKASNTKQTTTINCRICSRFRQIIDRCQHENVFFHRGEDFYEVPKGEAPKKVQKLISISPRAHNCCVSHTPRHKFLRSFFYHSSAILFGLGCKSRWTMRARSEKFASNPKLLIPRFYSALCKPRPVHCFIIPSLHAFSRLAFANSSDIQDKLSLGEIVC